MPPSSPAEHRPARGRRRGAGTGRAPAPRRAAAPPRTVPPIPELRYPDLPVAARKDDIAAAIRDHQVVVVAGETGSGKTTQLPKICLEVGRGREGLIGHTQPRRIAARSVAERIGGVADLALSRQEDEDVLAAAVATPGLGPELLDRLADARDLVALGVGALGVDERPVADLDGVGAPRHLDDRRGLTGGGVSEV